MPRRSQLFVPGNNEKMIRKAVSLPCDSLILDLEDAIPSEQKEPTRKTLTKLIRDIEWGRNELCVRVNPVSTSIGLTDISELQNLDRIDAFVIPKCETNISRFATSTGKTLMPIIETARGLLRLERVVSSKGVVAVSYGAGDFALSVGGSAGSYLDNMAIKTFIVATAKAYGVEAIDNVFFDLNDMDGFRKQALSAKGLGYTGKELVHPSQIPVANEVFSPDPVQIAWARRVVEEYSNASKKGIGAIRLDGQMVDVLQFKQAKKLLETVERLERC